MIEKVNVLFVWLCFNPLVPSLHKSAQIAQISILRLYVRLDLLRLIIRLRVNLFVLYINHTFFHDFRLLLFEELIPESYFLIVVVS